MLNAQCSMLKLVPTGNAIPCKISNLKADSEKMCINLWAFPADN